MSDRQTPWVKVLRDIVAWNDELVDVMCGVQAVSPRMGRSGRRVDPPMPGGQALALRVPTADRTDPESVVKDFALRLRRDRRDQVPLHRPMRGEAEYMVKHLDDLRRAGWADECWGELQAAWVALGEATGQIPTSEEGPRERVDLRALADEVPDEALLTLPEAERFWPGVSARVRTARSRDRVKRAGAEGGCENGPAQPDERRRYRVGDIRRWHLTPRSRVV